MCVCFFFFFYIEITAAYKSTIIQTLNNLRPWIFIVILSNFPIAWAILLVLWYFVVRIQLYKTLFIHTDICLSAHNKLRALHRNTPPFVWDDQLAADSQKWADYLSRRGSLTHDMNSGVGENLYWSQSWRSATKGDSTAKAALAW